MHDKSWGTSLFITVLHRFLRTEEAVFYSSAAQRHRASFVTFAIFLCYNVHVFGQHVQTTSGTIQLLNFLGNMAATKIVFTFIVIIT